MKYLTYVVIIVVVLGGGWYLLHSLNASKTASTDGQMMANETDNSSATTDSSLTGTSSAEATTSASVGTQQKVREFTVDGQNYSFSPATMTVKKGETVRVTFKNTGGMHDWVIDEFNTRTPRINSGQTAVVEFVADKAGTFEYYCSVGQHRAMGMKGTLTVTP